MPVYNPYLDPEAREEMTVAGMAAAQTAARARVSPVVSPIPRPTTFNGFTPVGPIDGAQPAPGTLVVGPGPTEAAPGPGEEWIWPVLAGIVGGLGYLLGDENGNGNGQPGAVVPGGGAVVAQNGGGVTPVGLQVMGSNWQAFADFGGFGKGSPQAEGWIAANRTTEGTGVISAETFRAWDPIQQRYYQLHGNNPYSNITLMPGRVLPGISGFITKTWVTHAWRKDGSLASTQMAMTSNGRMISISETGIMKNWRPYRSIVIGKSLTTRNLRRVSTRVKSHAKSLKRILSILK